MQKFSTLILFISICLQLNAQAPAKQLITITVVPNHKNWQYSIGEDVTFSVQVSKEDQPLENINVRYEVGAERMPASASGSLQIRNGSAQVKAKGLDRPGFLRCIVTASYEGKTYRGLATAGFAPLSIKTFTQLPDDFTSFWSKSMEDLSKVPMDVKVKPLPEQSTSTVEVYEVNIQNYPAGARLYGVIAVPKKEGVFPALLEVPGAGVRPYKGNVAMADKGVISLRIGIHGIPVSLEGSVYDDLKVGALNGYNTYHLDDRDRYYYKRVYLGCIRALDYICSLKKYDGTNLAVSGSSQGGALSIATAALDPRIKFLSATHPALCDLTASLHGRADGWPHMFTAESFRTPEKLNTSKYYDVVNFARLLKVPGLYNWGYNDETCPPSSMYAAYNEIKAPKKLSLYYDTGHWIYPQQRDEVNAWLVKMLTGR